MTIPPVLTCPNKITKRAGHLSQRTFWIRSLFQCKDLDEDGSDQSYAGGGTCEDPYIVRLLPNDRQNPMGWSKARKWTIAQFQAFSFFAVTFSSSVYASSIPGVIQHFHVSNEVAILGLALYVLGFAIGPLLWAPMSEAYGRRLTFMVSYTVYIVFTVAAPFANKITHLLLLRFFASAFGSSAQTNPGGMITDMFNKEERGPVMSVFVASPFLGPALGMSWICFFRIVNCHSRPR